MDNFVPRCCKFTSVGISQIKEFTDLLTANPVEFASDFRKFYGVSIYDIPNKISWPEAWLLLGALKSDSTSRIAVKLAGYTKPFTSTDVILADLYDLTHAGLNAGSRKKIKLYTRPWEAAKKLGGGSMTLNKAVDFFAKLGHKTTLITKD